MSLFNIIQLKSGCPYSTLFNIHLFNIQQTLKVDVLIQHFLFNTSYSTDTKYKDPLKKYIDHLFEKNL